MEFHACSAGGLDGDGDGFTTGQDCNDGNAAIRPGATEVCSGKKCPSKSMALKAAKVRRSASSVIGSLTKKQRRLRVGQTVEVWISAPNFNTKVGGSC